jgi:hypothetical protein
MQDTKTTLTRRGTEALVAGYIRELAAASARAAAATSTQGQARVA